MSTGALLSCIKATGLMYVSKVQTRIRERRASISPSIGRIPKYIHLIKHGSNGINYSTTLAVKV